MDFASLLGIANENSKGNPGSSHVYKSTKVSAAKKDPKQAALSNGVQKFLAKQKADEAKKLKKDEEKRSNLLELRAQNKKSQRVANSMLKRTKSSNKSAIDEARNNRDTAATLAGRFQCDQDDYGYESTTAGSIYEKLMRQYEANPEDPMAKFARPKQSPAAGKKPAAPAKPDPTLQPFRRPKPEEAASSGKGGESKPEKRAKKGPKPPPPPSFKELLAMAQGNKNGLKGPGLPGTSKNPKPAGVREAEFDRPMTAKEKEEFLRERNSKLRKAGKIPKAPEPAKKASKPAEAKKPEKKPEAVAKKPRPDVVEKRPAPDKQPSQKPLKRSVHDVESRPFPGEIKRPKKAVRAERSPSPLRSKAGGSSTRMRIESDDDDEEYDSEMDDFIDDSDAKVDISAEIRNIFGYDRRNFRNEADFDDRSMENNRFSDLMKEEARSAKIGRMEDLEDMRREEEEKRRKMMKKKGRR